MQNKVFKSLSSDADMQDMSIDSTSCKARQHSAGAKKGLKMRKSIKIQGCRAAAETQKYTRLLTRWAIR
jgi:hypothetical protein